MVRVARSRRGGRGGHHQFSLARQQIQAPDIIAARESQKKAEDKEPKRNTDEWYEWKIPRVLAAAQASKDMREKHDKLYKEHMTNYADLTIARRALEVKKEQVDEDVKVKKEETE